MNIMGSNNDIEAFILKSTFTGLYGFTTVLFVGKVFYAFTTAIDRKIAAIDARLNEIVGPAVGVLDFFRGISEWLGR